MAKVISNGGGVERKPATLAQILGLKKPQQEVIPEKTPVEIKFVNLPAEEQARRNKACAKKQRDLHSTVSAFLGDVDLALKREIPPEHRAFSH